MKKLRQPIIYSIENTTFLVDIDKQVLRQTNNLQNEISFISDLTDFGDHYLLAWDERTRSAGTDPEIVIPLIVPQLVELDPEGMSKKYGIPVNELAGKSDFEVIVDSKALAKRQEGILPQIDLLGEKFIIDLRLQEFRHATNFHPVISLKSFELTGDGWHYEAYYHRLLKQIVPLDPKLLELPDGVVKLKIPNELGLDPVEAARYYGMNERALLRRHPIRLDLKAEVIPLRETDVPAIIGRNREKLQQAHQQIRRKAKPRHRPQF